MQHLLKDYFSSLSRLLLATEGTEEQKAERSAKRKLSMATEPEASRRVKSVCIYIQAQHWLYNQFEEGSEPSDRRGWNLMHVCGQLLCGWMNNLPYWWSVLRLLPSSSPCS